MLRKVLMCVSIFVLTACGWAQGTRDFIFHYGFTVRNIPAGKKIKIWFPAAHSDAFQEVKVISATGDLPLKKTHESEYGNEIYYSAASKAKQSELHFEVVYDVLRHERLVLGRMIPHLEKATLNKRERQEDLQAYRLVPVTGLPAELAAKTTEGKTTTLEKARAIYDFVFDNMRYDKSGKGWGRGDVLYACSAKHGNCTDFHSLFISMARSQGIPARFEIGFAIPPDKHAGDIAGYHCWADFFDAEHGWVPVDISEAWLNPVKKDYYFGAHDDDRVQFTMGRDLILNPRQEGAPLNYFIYPYVEVAGTPYQNVSLAFSFADAESEAAEK